MFEACGLDSSDDGNTIEHFSMVTLSACSFLDEFTCDNGECINKYKRCDDSLDCSDYSDEDFCTVVEVDDDYRSGDPPKLTNKTNYINTTIHIQRHI